MGKGSITSFRPRDWLQNMQVEYMACFGFPERLVRVRDTPPDLSLFESGRAASSSVEWIAASRPWPFYVPSKVTLQPRDQWPQEWIKASRASARSSTARRQASRRVWGSRWEPVQSYPNGSAACRTGRVWVPFQKRGDRNGGNLSGDSSFQGLSLIHI